MEDKLLVAADTDGSIWVVDSKTEEPSYDWSWRARQLLSDFELSPSGKYGLLLFRNGRAAIWRLESPIIEGIRKIPQKSIISVTFKPDKEQDIFLATSRNAKVRLWQINEDGLHLLRSFQHPSIPVSHATFSDDGDRILTLADDLIPRIFDAASGKLLRKLDSGSKPDWKVLKGEPAVELEAPAQTRILEKVPFPNNTLPVKDIQVAGYAGSGLPGQWVSCRSHSG